MFNKLSRKFNITLTELRVLTFIILTLISGMTIKLISGNTSASEYINYDYSVQDSLFNIFSMRDSVLAGKEIANNDVDYKQEVLDFNARNFEKTEPKILPEERSMDINKADLEKLKTLPGIGEKTAKNILELREKRGKFRNISELLDVKGIGNSKFNKIKKFIFIEH